MQFNPACLSGSNTPNITPSNSCPNTPQPSPPLEYMSTPTIYSDGPPTQNPWASSVLGLPVYGIYNASLIPVPDAVPNQVTDTSVKKKSAKRPSQSQRPSDSNAMDEAVPTNNPEAEDRFQGMDEEQKQKRQRRLIKNREAAQQFRQRQKEYIQNLERRVTELNTHVGETHKHIELLTAENRLLRDQLVYLYNVMRQNLSLAPAASPSFSSTSLSSVPQSPSITPATTPPASPLSSYAAGFLQSPSTLSANSQMVDLSMLGFKGYNVADGNMSFDMLKATAATPIPTSPSPQTLSQAFAQHAQNLAVQQQLSQQQQQLSQQQQQQLSAQQQLSQQQQQLSAQLAAHQAMPPPQQNLPQHSLTAQGQIQSMTQLLTSPHTPPPISPPVSTPSTPTIMPDLGSMKIDIENAMLLNRFKVNDIEAQTVPVFVKNEGGGANL